MEISLFENRMVMLLKSAGVGSVTLGDGTVVRDVRSSTATASVPVTAELLDALKTAGLSVTSFPHDCPGSVGSNIVVRLTIGFASSPGPEGSMEGYLEADIANHESLTRHGAESSGDTHISVTINFIERTHQAGTLRYVPVDPIHSFRLISPEVRAKHTFKVLPDRIGLERSTTVWTTDHAYPDRSGAVVWFVTCSAKLIFSTYHGPDLSVSDHLVLNRRMLTEELYCDVVVIAKNKAEVKFHRSFLAAHSSVFNKMLQSGMAEARTGIIEMPDVTEEGVRALREYLYLWTLAAPMEKARICCELFELGHKYDIQALEKSMGKILFLQNPDWYSVNVALRLFLFARGRGEEGLEMKKKAVRVLKAKYDELTALASFQELFQKDIDAVKDLCDCLAKHSN